MDTEEVEIREFDFENMLDSCVWVVVGGPGSGKCLSFGTPVLMFNMTTREVQDINVGDKVMGPNGSIKTVTRLFRGKGSMYNFTEKGRKSTNRDKVTYGLTGNHTLSLVYKSKPFIYNDEKVQRFRVQYFESYIDEENLKKVKSRSKTFSYVRRSKQDARKEAEQFLSSLPEQDPEYQVTIEDYIKLSKKFKHNLNAYKTGVECPEQRVDLDPYMLGLWLGDGSSEKPIIYNVDPEVLSYLEEYANVQGLNVKKGTAHPCAYIFSGNGTVGGNCFLNALCKYNLLQNKHIPHEYIYNSRKVRLDVLAGLLDTDGYYDHYNFEIVQKNETLANDIVFLARSLGFNATIRECTKGCIWKGVMRKGKYQRIYISGDVDEIPCKISRKKSDERNGKKDVLHYAFDISYRGIEDYYGFETDGDHLFLLGDFTVTHNCLGKDTPVLLHSGLVKKVQDIRVGDQLMGDDNTPRNVLALGSGQDTLYKVESLYNMDSFVANGDHILCLKHEDPSKGNDVFEKSIKEYLDMNTPLSLYKTGARFGTETISEEDLEDLANLLIIDANLGDNLFRLKKIGACTYETRKSFINKLARFVDDISLYHSIKLASNIYYPTIKFIAESIGLNATYDLTSVRIFGLVQIVNKYVDCCRYQFKITKLDKGNYYGFQIDGNGRFLLGDFTVTHNTTFIENLVYYNRHKYPVAKACTGSDDVYRKLCKIFPPLNVSNEYDVKEIETLITRQRARLMENHHHPHNYCINIIDDVAADKTIFKSKAFKGLFKYGPQHWDMVTIVSSQCALDLPPELRKCPSYIALFQETNPVERKKLYNSFGGICGTEKDFGYILDQITGDYTCLIIDNRSQSKNKSDKLFYYKTRVLPTSGWKFGCDEYLAHAQERYNPDYTEKIS